MNEPLSFDEIAAVLSQVGYDDHPAAYHGSLCGAVCRQKAEEVDPALLLDDAATTPNAAQMQILLRLRDEMLAALTDLQSAFTPMLPDDEATLAERTEALGAWCEGFLFGIAGRIQLNLRECSEEVREIIKDFTEFTRGSLDSGESDETEENAYVELVEYVRVGAQLIFMELHPRHGAPGASPTIH